MRPSALDPLFAPAMSLAGVGPKVSKLLARLVQRPDARVIDVLRHAPSSIVDRRARPKIRDAVWGSVATIEARVSEHRPSAGRSRAPYRVVVEDDTGDMELVFFLTNVDWIKRRLPIGETRWISGKVELFDGHLQMVHPDKVLTAAEARAMLQIEPVYPLVEGLTQSAVRKAALSALNRLPIFPEWISDATLTKLQAPSIGQSLTRLHRPGSSEDVDPSGAPLRRLAFDELFANQLALRFQRYRMRSLGGRAQPGDGRLREAIRASLPFQLSPAQEVALDDIARDLAADKRMIRLLQGDVGSGKTILAFMAMAQVVEGGRQAALMAPTEILARQHAQRLAPIAERVGLRLGLIVGSDRGGARSRVLNELAAGTIDIAIGTHALFQAGVIFKDLGLAVVDEQHRFGVQQRLAFVAKGEAVDLLSMTATPIPRTLVLAFFGDMDVSDLREKPPGRKPIDTRAVPLDRIGEVTDALERAVEAGRRAYWICPLVEESESLEVAAAEERWGHLKGRFGDKVGLVHGGMNGADKDAAMTKFQSGETQILVATTVIEVGVDVPEASIIIVEQAERFGLAQLHQLRGRVGRGAASSSCVLLYRAPLNEAATARLSICGRPRTDFGSRRKTCACEGKGTCLACVSPARRSFILRSWTTTKICCAWRARKRKRRFPKARAWRANTIALCGFFCICSSGKKPLGSWKARSPSRSGFPHRPQSTTLREIGGRP